MQGVRLFNGVTAWRKGGDVLAESVLFCPLTSTTSTCIMVAMKDFLLVREVADRLGVSGETVRRFVADGRLPGARKKDPMKRTSPMLIPLAAVDTLERELRGGSEPEEKDLGQNSKVG